MHPASRHRQFVRRGNSRSLSVRQCRRLISLLVLLGIVCTYLPLPAPALAPFAPLGTVLGSGSGHGIASVQKDVSRPFPCAQRVCGCRSAEQCWRKCCCFSDAEKVAWADARGVALPDFVRQSAARAADARSSTAGVCATTGRGAGDGKSACAHCEPGTQPDRLTGVPRASGRRPPQSPSDGSLSEVVIVQDALACQGIHWQWQVSLATPQRPPVTLHGLQPPATRLLVSSLPRPANPLGQVPTPPPRRSPPPGSPA